MIDPWWLPFGDELLGSLIRYHRADVIIHFVCFGIDQGRQTTEEKHQGEFAQFRRRQGIRSIRIDEPAATFRNDVNSDQSQTQDKRTVEIDPEDHEDGQCPQSIAAPKAISGKNPGIYGKHEEGECLRPQETVISDRGEKCHEGGDSHLLGRFETEVINEKKRCR